MGMANRLDDKDNEGHNGLPIQGRLAAEAQRADYAWRNVRAIDAHRMAKEAEATAHIKRLRTEIALLRHHLTELAKVADRAAMVLTTVRLVEDDPTTENDLQEIIDGIQTWAPDALLEIGTQNAKSQAAAPQAQVACTDGLGVDVPQVPSLGESDGNT